MALAGVHVSGRSSPVYDNLPSTSNLIIVDSLRTKLDTESKPLQNNHMLEVNEIIFNSQILKKQWERDHESEPDDSCDEEIHLLPSRDREYTDADPVSH